MKVGTSVSHICYFTVYFYQHPSNFQTESAVPFHCMVLDEVGVVFYLYSLFVFLKRRLLFCETFYCISISVFISVYKFSLMVALLLDGSTHPCSKLLFGTKVSLYSALPSANSDQFDVATVLDLMQYRLLPYIWHHCTYNSTSSDAVLVTSLTVGITVPTTALALMQYSYLPADISVFHKYPTFSGFIVSSLNTTYTFISTKSATR